jgi:hypothetical protein
VGVLVGVGAAWAATRLITSTLFELTAIDPLTLAFAIDESAPDLTLTLRHRRR